MWVRYKQKFADGGESWDWLFLGGMDKARAELHVKELAHEWRDEYNWSDHYRGVEWHLEETAPREVVEKALREAEARTHAASVVVGLLTDELARLFRSTERN